MRPLPAVILGRALRREVDGHSDDLLTAGLGLAGLRGPVPEFADPLAPTPTELRRRAVYQSYRGLLDVSDAGGFGRLYGPLEDLRIAGVEYLVAVQTPDGRGKTTVCVQIPAHFDATRPLLLAVASSGSRGIYGALPTAAEWGLRRGAAVVHSDKGTGNGIWDVDRARGYLIDGTLSADATDPLQLYVPETGSALGVLGRTAPHSLLFKHAHSGMNVESRWGVYLLQAIQVALDLLTSERGQGRGAYTTDNTMILAAGVSNGGATVLRALEADAGSVIDGAVVSEPNAVVGSRTAGLRLQSGNRVAEASGFGLYDYSNLHYLLQPAAVLAETDPGAPFASHTVAARAVYEKWCHDLQAMGLLPAGSIADGALAARRMLLDAGMLDCALALGHFNLAAGLWSSVMVTYAAAYGRLKPWEQPYGLGFAMVDANGLPRAVSDREAATLWCDGSGIPPTAGATLISAGADGTRRADPFGSVQLALAFAPERLLQRMPVMPRTTPDQVLLLARIADGHSAVVMSGAVGNRPVVMLHGRADGLIPVNHSSRPYYAIAQASGGAQSLHYYEVVHGQHFDAFLGFPGFAERYVPLQPWIGAALDRVYARLTGGAQLPPSQVVRSRPRAAGPGGLEALSAAHLGALRDAPDADAIRWNDQTLYVPD